MNLITYMKNILTLILLVMMFCSGGSILNKAYAVWQPSNGIPNNVIVFCAVSKGSVMIAGTSSGNFTTGALYRSTDNGSNWAIVNTNVTNLSGIFSLTVKDNFIFAGTYEDGLLKSTDDGLTWTQDNVSGSQFAGVFRLGVSGSTLVTYLNVNANYYLTTNNGQNWSTYTIPAAPNITSFYTDGPVIYAASQKGLFSSTNNGFNWTQGVNNGLPANPDGTKRLIAITSLNNKLFVSTNQPVNSVYASTDGNNWTQTNMALSTFSFVSSMEVSGSKIFAGIRAVNNSPDYGVAMTTNEGASWMPVNAGMPAGASVFDILIKDNKVYACTYLHGVLSSDIETLTSIGSGQLPEPEGYSLSQNYPNPFNPVTNFEFRVADFGFVSLKVYNLQGKEIQTLVSKNLNRGTYNISFDGSGLESGIYFYKLEAGDFSETRKMVIVK
jgi:photosystem II stability/assembly factor-like uncharacterized protein